MAVEIKVPSVGESITEVQIIDWLKAEGDEVGRDEPVVVIETEKATLEVPSPVAGRITKHLHPAGEWVKVGDAIATLEENGAGAKSAPKAEPKKKEEPKRAAAETAAAAGAATKRETQKEPAKDESKRVMPAAKRAMAEHGVSEDEVMGTGPGGRVTKEDVMRLVQQERETEEPAAERPQLAEAGPAREEDIVPMSALRRTVARRLVEAQQTAALLTTFNEIDMSEVVELRKQYRDTFSERHGVKLGFMSFFVKASVDALKQFPQVNAEIRGENIVYHNYYDIGIAVGGGKGLVVPVLRNADRMSFAELEKTIADFAARAQQNKLKLEELSGGTFTISNGGIYGSMLSTPIINPPQSGILGLHAIQDRPVARDGQVVIRPMMYVALTYDHRIVDGREAVTFLKRIKEAIEDPARLLLEI